MNKEFNPWSVLSNEQLIKKQKDELLKKELERIKDRVPYRVGQDPAKQIKEENLKSEYEKIVSKEDVQNRAEQLKLFDNTDRNYIPRLSDNNESNHNEFNSDALGRHIPIVKINDYFFRGHQIDFIQIDCKDMIPTIKCKFSLDRNNPLTMNIPKDGDLVSIFMRPMNDLYKSIRCDFLITDLVTSWANQSESHSNIPLQYDMFISGKLHIPNIYTEGLQFAVAGSSKDALKKVAEVFKLGFVESPETDMEDKQVWYMYGQKPLDFVEEVVSHAWRDENSFFNAWIDPFYNLSFINVNLMLGRSKADDGSIDIASYYSNTGTENKDRTYVNNGDKSTTIPKLMTNMPQLSHTPFFVNRYSVVNNSSKISAKYGHIIELDTNLNNQNLSNASRNTKNRQIVRIEPCFNKEKLLDHIILRGRANDGFNNNLNNSQETNVRFIWAGDSQVMSKDDHKGSNTNHNSGNVRKDYIRAYYHNLLNNVELEKIKLNIELKGLNTAILRGEKIPTLLLHENYFDVAINQSITNSKNGELSDFNMFYSGWFIVTALRYLWERPKTSDNAPINYKTIVTLSRREWIPPEAISPIVVGDDGKIYRNPNAQQYGFNTSNSIQDVKKSKDSKVTVKNNLTNETYSKDIKDVDYTKESIIRIAVQDFDKNKVSNRLKQVLSNIPISSEQVLNSGVTHFNTGGIKFNNPSYLRNVKSVQWEGLLNPISDNHSKNESFCKFDTLANGYRAFFINLRTVSSRMNEPTIKNVIHTLSPPFENDTANYIKNVSDLMSVTPNTLIDIRNKEFMKNLAIAITIQEHGGGIKLFEKDVDKGYDMAKEKWKGLGIV